MQHLEDYVTLDTYLHDGVVYARRRWWLSGPVSGLYVHPVTGLLRATRPKARPRWRDDREPNFVYVNETLSYEKIDGFWYRFDYTLGEENVRKHQVDAKTTRQIENGELGRLTVRIR